jgi:hypothetical protein
MSFRTLYQGEHAYAIQALSTGGKAGKNCNATSSFRAVLSNMDKRVFKVKTFRFRMDSHESFVQARDKAIAQARAWEAEQSL